MQSSSSSRVFLTGGSGTLGTELRKIADKYNIDLVCPTSKECNILDQSQVFEKIKDSNCDTVIHAAAATDVPGLQSDPLLAAETNTIGTYNVLRVCVELGLRMVFISTDYVFDGESGNYTTDSPINPLSVYAKSKAAGELLVRSCNNTMVIRTSFFGKDFPHPMAFEDQWSSKDYVDIIAPKILDCITGNSSGIFHVGSSRRTIYDIAKTRRPDVKKGSRTIVKHKVPRDTSMIISESKGDKKT
jgi:dTDP-4-dehydrorhamnose reductase